MEAFLLFLGAVLAAALSLTGTIYGIRVANRTRENQQRMEEAARQAEARTATFDELKGTVEILEGQVGKANERLNDCLNREASVSSDNVKLAGQVYKMSLALEREGIKVEDIL